MIAKLAPKNKQTPCRIAAPSFVLRTGHANNNNNAFKWTPGRQQRIAGTGNQELEGGRGAAEQANIQHGAHDGCDEIGDHVFEGKTLRITLLFGDDGMWWTDFKGYQSRLKG